MRAFVEQLRITERTRVLDIGGTAYNWQFSPVRPRLTIVNLEPATTIARRGSSRFMATLALDVRPDAVDVVLSNPVIEHVSDHARFAAKLRCFDRPCWVQTPNPYFPIEPHFLGLGVQFLPRWAAQPYIKYATIWGRRTREEHTRIPAMLEEIPLLSAREMRCLFPGATLLREQSTASPNP